MQFLRMKVSPARAPRRRGRAICHQQLFPIVGPQIFNLPAPRPTGSRLSGCPIMSDIIFGLSTMWQLFPLGHDRVIETSTESKTVSGRTCERHGPSAPLHSYKIPNSSLRDLPGCLFVRTYDRRRGVNLGHPAAWIGAVGLENRLQRQGPLRRDSRREPLESASNGLANLKALRTQ